MSDIFSAFFGQSSTVVAVAEYMRDHNLTPPDVLAAHETWLEDLRRGSATAERATRNASTPPRRHRAGDTEVFPSACPICAGDLEMLQLCHISSPKWRTQLACMSDACAWHGKSRLPIDALLATGPAGINKYVTEE